MSLTPEQQEIRRHGIGGSEISAVLGLHPFCGALEVYLRKTQGWESPPNPDMERGTYLEDGIARWYAARHCEGRALVPGQTITHFRRPVALCTPDFVDATPDPKGGLLERLVSIKAPRRAGDVWGETGGTMVPEYAVLQLQWEDAILRSRGADLMDTHHLVALVEGDLRVYPVARDEELQGWMLDAAEKWWAKHVVAKVPPPLDGSDTASAWLRQRFPRNLRPLRPAGLDGEALLLRLQQARAGEAIAKAEVAHVRQLVEESIGDADGIEGAVGRVTWRARKDGCRVFKTQFNLE